MAYNLITWVETDIGTPGTPDTGVSAANLNQMELNLAEVAAGTGGAPKILTAALNALAVTEAKIAAGAVTVTKIGAKAVTTAKIADAAIEALQVANNAIVTNALINGAVNASKISASAVTTVKVNNAAITLEKMADNSVGNSQMLDDSVDTAELVDSSVETAKLNNLATTTAKIDNGAVTGEKLQPAIYAGYTDLYNHLLSPAERTTTSPSPIFAKVKEVIAKRSFSSVLVSFALKSLVNGINAAAKIYVNDIAVGVQRNNNSNVYVPFTESISNIDYGDTIQIYATVTPGTEAHVNNLELVFIEDWFTDVL